MGPTLKYDESTMDIYRRINATDVPYPADRSIADLFEDCVRRGPDNAALVFGDETISYRELNGLANGLAARLRDAGLAPGGAVGLCLPRTPELIVALLAILKCGCAYLPFASEWPDERIRTLLRQANVEWILAASTGPSPDRFPDVRVWPVDRAGLTDRPENLGLEIGSEQIAYINFTSGSTGVPKGVPIQHRSIARLVFSPRYVRLGRDAVVLQMAPLSFDAATFEVWGALLRGGRSVLYPAPFIRLSTLKTVLRKEAINVLWLTTALFNTIVDESPETLDSVRTILIGGEAQSPRHLEKALRRYGRGRLVNGYGPTECTTFATFHPIDELAVDEPSVPIGRPIQNTRVYVVDGGRLCLPGEVGEVLLAGPGLTPGYLTPEISENRFVHHEIDGVTERLYRTGDLAYLREDGNLVFRGRLDDQVKISGYRVELDEVAYHLEQDPRVRRCAVTVEKTELGDKRLVAFVVPAEDDGADGDGIPARLRADLRRRVPAYLIPAVIELRASLPLTANGKVDRGALLTGRCPA